MIDPGLNIGIKIGNNLVFFFSPEFYIRHTWYYVIYNFYNTLISGIFLDIGIDQDRDLVDTSRDREVRVGVKRNPDVRIESVPRKKANKCVYT